MTLDFKIVVDCADPHRQAVFWSEALGYLVEDNSPIVEQLVSGGMLPAGAWTVVDGRKAFRTMAAVRHPEDPFDPATGIGHGRRLLFQAVPEAKTVKNRLHLDLHAGPERREEEVDRLVGLGATVLARIDEPGGRHVTLADPEGNEFCVQ
ncbi:VOC family protein [Kitasatospora sp. DSM 101779]|uniref:VOC family protein n=1 Tax=Kitasatospora sp. DSM 101779 TaxID=2853165 RepID=UPI0021D8D4C6|nr:VOC family protein [Kitasatospora sp. DSM 101779]MCU7822752.1 hypothetical protein [Kitasatospora sp. DSM 101779]